MQTILNNLQQIEDLDVTSRTTLEQYRSSGKTIPEISEELGVNYFVEGSGQKVDDKILLTIQLIDGRNDRQIWSKQYERQITDIFALQTEVARNIASEVQASITPEEERNISRIPTENLVAYDHYLKGLDFLGEQSGEGLTKAIIWFKKAIEEDASFSQAYAYVAICYYYMDIYQAEKKFGLEINTYADKANLYGPDLPESLIAKGLFYMQDQQYELAIEYFEKVLSYSPNAVWVHNFLSDIYTSYIPNTEKYLSHALRGIRSAVAVQDSMNASYSYLHLSNALAQSGFVREAEMYVKESLNYNPENKYAMYLQAYLKLMGTYNMAGVKSELVEIYHQDTTDLYVIQEIGKICYYMEDYKEAWKYYRKFLNLIDHFQLSTTIFPGEDLKIAWSLSKLKRPDEAKFYYERFKNYAANDSTIYKELILSSYHASQGNVEKGIQHLKAFSKERNFIYWIIVFLDRDPIFRQMEGHPEYAATMKRIKSNFWEHHDEIKRMLEKEGVMDVSVAP
jgi:tetratricopeptide (TPR) repeat protein